MALWDVASPEKPSCRISSIWKMCVLDSMVSILYRMKVELGPWDDNIVVIEVWVLTSFVEVGAA